MVHYEQVKILINVPRFVKVIIPVVVWHHGLPNFIVTDKGSLFTSKFWSSLCYFLGIKRRLSTAFHPQTDGQIERHNSTIKVYFQAFVNFEQNKWARLLLMAKFAYNNAKNTSIGHTPFKLNCGYHLHVFFEKNTDFCFQSKTAKELSSKLKNLMTLYRENLYHTQKLEKRAYNKSVKPRGYTPGNQVWLNNKYIKTKWNQKLEANFFGPFQVLYSVNK